MTTKIGFLKNLFIISFAVACSDAGVTAYNANPEATITSHQGNEPFLDGYVVTFRGSVSDADNAATELSTRWFVGTTEACGSATPSADGISECDILLVEDDNAITLEVIDPENAAGSASIELTVAPTNAPTVEIIYPELAATYYADQLMTFEGQGYDEEDDAIDLVFTWESNLDGPLTVEADPDVDGLVTGFGFLSSGDHAITLSAIDLTGKIGTDVVTVSVGPANSNPTCEITQPEDGDAGTFGELVLFKANVDDADIAADQLSVVWTSDKDGELGTSTADSSGSVSFGWSELSVNTHVISLAATDDVGETCTANVIYTVGEPPAVTIDSPATGDTFTVGDQVVFAGTVSDNEDLATALSVEWSSDLNGTFSTTAADSTGSTNVSTSSLDGGLHNISLTATDTDGLYATHNIQISLNNPPTVSGVSINPATGVGVNSSLTCVASGDDTEDGALSPSVYAWTNDTTGASLGSGSGVSLSSATVSSGNTVTCQADFIDTDGASVSGSDSVTVGNSAPTISGVTISPNPAYASASLSCAYTGFADADSDSDASEYSWTINGVVSGDSANLFATLVVGDLVECMVTPYDGSDFGSPQQDSLVVSNSPPVLAMVTLSPDPAQEGDTLTCAPSGATDVDGTIGFTYTYEWTVNGIVEPSAASATLNDAYFARNDTVFCDVTPNDGTDDGAAVTSNTVTIANSLPSITSVTISPIPASASDTLTCSYIGFYDADADADGSTYEWAVNGVIAGSSVTLYGAFSGSDTVACTVTPFDGTDEGAPLSYEIVIGNQAPSVSSVSISPTPAYAGDSLSCTYSGYYDADGDPDVSTIAWTVNGSGAGTGANLSTSLASGDVVICSVTPYDGILAGTVGTATLTISNTPPVLSSVTLSPDPATEGDTLSCSVGTTTDADGTVAFSYTYGWTVNGADIGVSAYSLSSADFDRDDDVACYATPNDGTNYGATVTSNIVKVNNSVPSISVVTITPAPATAVDTLTCSWSGFYDLDGDADASTAEWSIGGSVVGTGATLMSGFTGGDTVTCTVTPFDGTDSGASASSSVTIGNSAPSISSVTVMPDPAYAGDTLTCSYSGFADIDGGTDSSTFAWYLNGALTSTNSALGAAVSSGDIAECVVTPNDGTIDGPPLSDSVTVSNTPPVLSSVTLSPDPATEADTLSCVVGSTTDADGTSAFSFTYGWKVNGGSIGVASYSLSGAYFDRGDDVSCTATPTDGTDDGAMVTSNVVTINNTPPLITGVAITPDPATASDTLTCTATGFTDIDGDADNTTFQWTVDGVNMSTSNTIAGLFIAGSVVACTATPDDGTNTGTSMTTSVTINNSAPELASVLIGPDPAQEGDTLVCTPGAISDADGDTSFTYTYNWFVNSVPLGASSNSLDDTNFVKDDAVYCLVTPSDGVNIGTAASSSVLTILNSAPEITGASITPDPATVSDTLICAAAGFSDADGDTDLSTYAWQVNGVSAGSSSVLGSGFAGGDGVTCTVTPFDGTDYGTPYSKTLIIGNSVPSISSVTISPTPAYEGDVLTCMAGGFYDADADADLTGYEWTIGGVPVGTGMTLSSGFSIGDAVTCTATPFDGSDYGIAMNTSVTIGELTNNAPSISSVTITPNPASASDTLICNYSGYYDADGDADASTIIWSIAGVPVGTSSTLSGVFSAGNTVTCTVTPYDGVSAGATVADSVTIDNNSPVISSVSLSPSVAYEPDTLTCAATATDAEGDAITYNYNWTVSGSAIGTTGTTLTGTDFSKGDTVTCTVTANDGSSDSAPVTSGSAVIYNSAPSLTSATITPNPAMVGDILTCAWSGWSDDDGDYDTSTATWSVGGSTIGTGATISSGFTAGDIVVCTVTPYDGEDTGATVTASVAVSGPANNLPVVWAVTISPASVYTNTAVNATVNATDADGDPITLYYDWYVDGVVTLSGEDETILSGVVHFDRDQMIHVEVTPDDGIGSGVTVASGSVTVLNTEPGAPSVSLTPATPSEGGDDLVCGIDTESTDADGDTVSYTISWEVDAVAWTGAIYTTTYTGDTISSGDIVAGERWTCTVTPNDGADDGATDFAFVEVLGGTLDRWPSAVYTSEHSDFAITGISNTDYTGYAISSLGDIDGDGLSDLIIGTPRDDEGDYHYIPGNAYGECGDLKVNHTWYIDDMGSASVFKGSNLSGLSGSYNIASYDNYYLKYNESDSAESCYGAQTGYAVSSAGDVDGDGLDDVLVAGPEHSNDRNTYRKGRVWLIFGSSMTSDKNLGSNDYSWQFSGIDGDDYAGRSVASAGDVDGDGLDEIIIGAPDADDGGTKSGAAYLFYGSTLAGSGGDLSMSDAAYTFVGENAYDSAGYSVASAGDVDGDGLSDILIGAYGSDANGSDSGVTYLMFAANLWAGSGTVDLADADYRFIGEADTHSGEFVSSAGDVDGDTLDDIMITAHESDLNGTNSGAVHIVSGGWLAPAGGDYYLTDSLYTFVGAGEYDYLGHRSAASAGDVDGDGQVDFLFGAYSDDDWAGNAGKAFLQLGANLPGSGVVEVGGDFQFVAASSSANFGYSTALLDYDGDGLDDVFVGAYGDDSFGYSDGGAVYAYNATDFFDGGYDLDLDYTEYVTNGESSLEIGSKVRSAGDVDGDGFEDLLVSVPLANSEAGETLLIYGSTYLSDGVVNYSHPDIQRFRGEFAGDWAGISVSPAGDVDNDGLDDLLIGAPYNAENGNYSGQSYLILASSLPVNGGSLSLDDAKGTNLANADYHFLGESTSDYSGYSVAGVGDVDGDGFDDLLIGAPYNDDYAINAGAAYLVLGHSLGADSDIDLSTAYYQFVGENIVDYAGYSVAAAGDVDGDGLADLLIGANGNDDGGNASGKSYLVLAADLPPAGGEVSLADAHYSFAGENAADAAGEALSSAGDIDGDGLDDLLFGAPSNDDGGNLSGKCYLVFGASVASPGSMSLADADRKFVGDGIEEFACQDLAPTGDVDGDGLDDLLIGAAGNDEWGGSAGKAFLYYGWTVLGLSDTTYMGYATAGDREYDYGFVPTTTDEDFGYSTLGADINNDGFSDLVIGAPVNSGKIYIKLSEGF